MFVYKDERDSLRQHLLKFNVPTLGGVVRSATAENLFMQRLSHRVARDPECCYSKQEIQEFLSDTDELADLMINAVRGPTMFMKWTENQSAFDEGGQVFSNLSSCIGCVSLKENPMFVAQNQRQTNFSTIPIQYAVIKMPDNQIGGTPVEIHKSTAALELAVNLLAHQEDADGLLLAFISAFNQTTGKLNEAQIIDIVMHFVVKGSASFPRLAELSTQLLSLIAIRHPSALLHRAVHVDKILTALVEGRCFWIAEWMGQVDPSSMILPFPMNDKIEAEIRYATKCLTDMLPILYHFGNWREDDIMMQMLSHNMGASLLKLMMVVRDHADLVDCPPDLKKHPYLEMSTKVCFEPLLGGDCVASSGNNSASWRQTFLREHPISFAMAGWIEVFGFWAYKGCDLHGSEIYRVHAVCDMIGRLLQTIPTRSPRLAYAELILLSISNKQVPALPSREESLLYDMLCFQHRRCGLMSCRKTAQQTSSGALLRCAGGCAGLEHYCCREHQLQHWKMGHKDLCKRLGRNNAQAAAAAVRK